MTPGAADERVTGARRRHRVQHVLRERVGSQWHDLRVAHATRGNRARLGLNRAELEDEVRGDRRT